jgi:hypothetical protein
MSKRKKFNIITTRIKKSAEPAQIKQIKGWVLKNKKNKDFSKNDILVLPEQSFKVCTNAQAFAKNIGMNTICGVAPYNIEGKEYNAALCINANGTIEAKARKSKLWNSEKKFFDKPDKFEGIVEAFGEKFLISTCYDICEIYNGRNGVMINKYKDEILKEKGNITAVVSSSNWTFDFWKLKGFIKKLTVELDAYAGVISSKSAKSKSGIYTWNNADAGAISTRIINFPKPLKEIKCAKFNRNNDYLGNEIEITECPSYAYVKI